MSTTLPHDKAYRMAQFAASAASALAILFICMKGWLFAVTGASSFLASLLDSGMDLCLSIIVFLGLRWAEKPADKYHRYGYGKIEALIGLAQAALATMAASVLAWQAGVRLRHPVEFTFSGWDIAACAFMVAGTSALVAFQTLVIRKTGSLAVKGDRAHYLGDIISNASLLILVLVNTIQPVTWLDPIITLIIATLLLVMMSDIVRSALSVLLDREVSEERREEFFVAASLVKGVESIHDLRVIEIGQRVHISLDIELDGHMSLTDAHDIAKNVENALLALSSEAEIMIHMDPVGALEDSRHENLQPMHFT